MSDAAKLVLLGALEGIGEAHEFAVSGVLDLVLPGLRVAGAGGSVEAAADAAAAARAHAPTGWLELTLPVAPADARALIAAAERAPFGRGEETVVDLAVRSVWQIGPEGIAFGNPRWPDLVAQIVGTVADAFAIRRPIRARLYKLLIYETGSHFVAHKDSEKEDGMFATLVVYLPSQHEGGRLVVRHAGAQKAFDLGGDAGAYALQYAAFYTDCEHEVEPLTDGYRVALVYNLLLADAADPAATAALAAPEHSEQAEAIADALASLFEEEALERVAIGLEHDYSQAGLAPSLLKGADRARLHVLAGIAAFARDREAQVHRFKVAKARRQHLHQQIDGLRLDMTHVTERRGSPQTLVCTKTRGAYERAVAQYERDLQWLEALGAP